ncbi:hypothetical protein IVB22_39750 [Bradyrhizobium sp. 190]|uniref:hypothetical protein n=1 Tax=Bradyrhizobium sp. 190 TaxID=2782658 RepID=UPI001FF77AE8|nr:hypothetical protein [Bradyrhizobium sp. 190]MCK1518501.1 hypothetical protein [Bradyrhizobium sp. 190]
MDHVAKSLAKGSNDGWIMERARYVAECQVQLERVKVLSAQTIQELIYTNLNDQKQVNAILGRLKKLESYERRARSRRRNALRAVCSIAAEE